MILQMFAKIYHECNLQGKNIAEVHMLNMLLYINISQCMSRLDWYVLWKSALSFWYKEVSMIARLLILISLGNRSLRSDNPSFKTSGK